MTIVVIDDQSPHLQEVKAIWRVNSDTLGFLPEGAFQEYAANRHILVALDESNRCVGYLLYRGSRDRVITIHHLCVDGAARGQGTARELVNYLKAITPDYLGIKLSCRRDFAANKMWPQLGFVAQGNKPGKSQDGKELTIWWLDYGHPNLFTWMARSRIETKLQVVIDANVFFDLHSEDGKEESKALLADWLQDSLQLCITDELFNEINRNPNSQDRRHQKNLAQRYHTVTCPLERVEEIARTLRPLFPEPMTEQDGSDLRQLARTIASDTQFFITRDGPMLERVADEVYKTYGVSLVSPAGLICKLDELRRETEYRVSRLAGTLSLIKRVRSSEEIALTQYFQNPSSGETKPKFEQSLRQYLANPERYMCRVAQDTNNEPLALIVYDRQNPEELCIPMLRVWRGSLAGTLARYLIFQAVTLSAVEKRVFTRITEPYLDETIIAALQDDLFSLTGDNGWLKINLAIIEEAKSLARSLRDLSTFVGQTYAGCSDLAYMLEQPDLINQAQTMVDIERILWPAKVADANIPTFIVPIKASWAHQLFDEKLANQTLFGAEKRLALNRESVYYRSQRFSGGLRAPGRVLWYISNDPRYTGTKYIRACSRLDEIIVDKPKPLYRKFRRLGVYEWEHLFEVAEKNIDQTIMALRFSDTELFTQPVPLRQAEAIIIKAGGKPNNFQSPLSVSSQVFREIYTMGQQIVERKINDA